MREEKFITFRRYYLDAFLESIPFSGVVLDVGGKKINKRGKFRPLMDNIESWDYLNIDPSTNPDFCCSAENIPTHDEAYDWVLLCEVLEHLSDPCSVLDECIRILKPCGRLVITAPFLNAIHADPYDFQRWTPSKYNVELKDKRGMEIEVLKEMGGIWAVIWDLFYSISSPEGPESKKKHIRKALEFTLSLVKRLECKQWGCKKITTGYALICKKVK